MDLEGAEGVFGMAATVPVGEPYVIPRSGYLMFDESGAVKPDHITRCLMCEVCGDANNDLGKSINALYNRVIQTQAIDKVFTDLAAFITTKTRGAFPVTARDVYQHFHEHKQEMRLMARTAYQITSHTVQAAAEQLITVSPDGRKSVSFDSIRTLEAALRLHRSTSKDLEVHGIVSKR